MAQAANPFFGTYKTPHQTVPFDKIKLSHYEPAFKKAIEENQKEIDAIVNQRSMPTFENTIEALDRSGQMLNRVASAFFALLSAESNDEMMEISQRVQPMLSEHSNNISLNEKLFDRIKFVYDRRDQLDLTPEQKTLLKETYESFALSGAELKGEDREQYRKLSSELAHTHIRTKCFERNQSFQHDALRERFGRTPPKRARCRCGTSKEQRERRIYGQSLLSQLQRFHEIFFSQRFKRKTVSRIQFT